MAEPNPSVSTEKYALDVSVVVACYREEASVSALYERLRSALENQTRSYEIIFVNDGSTDQTLDALLAIAHQDPHVVVVDFMANYGQWQAMTAGICLAKGRTIAFLDCDLQVDPADLPNLLDRFDEGFDMVGGRRVQREDSLVRKAISRIGNIVLKDLTKGELKDLGCSMKVFRADLLHAFDFGPMTPFRPLQVIAAASRVAELPIRHQSRPHGQSNWPVAVLAANFGFAFLDLMQGRMRRLGVYSWLAAFVACLVGILGLITDESLLVFWGFLAAILLQQAGLMLFVVDLLILTLVARRVNPAYLIREIYRYRTPNGDTP